MTVKSISLILFNLFLLNLHSQEGKSILKNCQKIDVKKFIELKKNNPKVKTISVFENGNIISKKDFDSIARNGNRMNRKQTFYRDTISNNFIIVNRELTEKEIHKRKIVSENRLKNEKDLRKKLNGSIIKELDLEDINEKKYNLNSLKGKVIVLNFWFIQCKPCVAEFFELNELKNNFKSKPVEFFAVTFNNKKSLNTFFKKHKLDFTVIPNGRHIINQFKIPYYPYHLIIDQNGKIEYISDVLSLNVIKKVKRKINKLL